MFLSRVINRVGNDDDLRISDYSSQVPLLIMFLMTIIAEWS